MSANERYQENTVTAPGDGQTAGIGDAAHPGDAIATLGALPLADLLEMVRARRDAFDAQGYVPRDMVLQMKRAGIYRASTPKRFGGDAKAPADFLRVLEQIAIVDGSTAWVAAFGSANVYLAALPLETQAEIYKGGPDQVFAGGLYPLQPAERVEGGWQVSGQWHFASGCKGADWHGVGIGGTAATGSGAAAGKPLTAVFRAGTLEIVDNWDVFGMEGTGSHDLKATGQVVTDPWTFTRGTAAQIDEPLYRYPAVAYQAQVHAACNVGIARAALDKLIEMSGVTKTTTGAPRLADRTYYRSALAKAEAQWHSARAFFYGAAEAAWTTIQAGDPVSPEQANLLRLSAVHAARTCADIVQEVHRLGGIAAIYRKHPLQKMVRDAMVVTQHAFLNEAVYEGAGSMFVGLTPSMPYP
ncbi:acyl-CoA dehydrogenase family protein [Robbsia sp. KACC 23696]|uniref:acyl-CoA dehydrogenase family protein n=1 Tax=Robbsia sp. KACC 23696 TaxID=3149231 RepID=UPI00325B2668